MIKVRIPATSANIGPGFDSLGMALNIYNTFIFEEISEGLEIIGCDEKFNNDNNLVYTSMMKTFKKTGYDPKGVRIIMDTEIPVSRGLGSSAACILGGVIGANILSGGLLSKDDILEIATEIEGHPDNVAPALFGGLVVSIMENNKVYYNNINIAKGLKFVALIPDFTLSTEKARSVLPSQIPYKDAIYNVSRVSLLLSALTNGRFDLLKYAIKDILHQPYRGKLIPDFYNIIDKCQELGSLGSFLSGAGPTIMSIIDENNNDFIVEIRKYLDLLNNDWHIKELELDLSGATSNLLD